MKKPGRQILYGAGMLAMSMSLTSCDFISELNPIVPGFNRDVYGPPEDNPSVYGPPESMTQDSEGYYPDEGDILILSGIRWSLMGKNCGAMRRDIMKK